MDAQRSIVIVALAVVSYMLVLAWNQDYGVPIQAGTTPQIQSDIAGQQSSAGAAGTTSSTELAPLSSQPQISSTESAAGTSPKATIGGETIQVKTDVLDLTIDLTGGNVKQALLEEYKLTLNSDLPLPLLQTDSERTYFVESGLYGKNGFDSKKVGPTPVYSASAKSYTLSDNEDKLVIDLNFVSPTGVKVIKRYTLHRGSYLIDVAYLVDNQGSQPWEGHFGAKIVRDQSKDPSNQSSMGMRAFLGMVLSTEDKPYEKFKFDDMIENPVNLQAKGGWVAFLQHYFISAWIPQAEEQHAYQSRQRDNLFLMGFTDKTEEIAAGSAKTFSAKLYLGPKILDNLNAAAPNLNLTVDYGWLFFIAKPLFLLLNFLHEIVGNWGVAIILVTIIVKALFYRLSATSYRSMANMRKLSPKLQQLKEQYGDDRQKMSQAMMELYKKEKINPLGGCLPILVQMPVFISLYWVIMETVQLRQAPFFFWIQDLSVMDPYFILPILMGISMFIQTSLNPTPPDPMQARVMKIMPVMFSVFFLWFPAGLVLYWVVNNVLSIAQQWMITRSIENAA